ncbi:FAD-dependent oxidoreductase [Bdellovibrio svalbardensis]|uniref:FAD-dependent oxidoreductase n=1 Tax=Bdellovibrio svalbardensis TaxID=2972972 RepID=A0ABT6DL34_9BACT|nr:FAD-dependent oxidoreductase [Bdellovibrio svalbardensis]MDG0817586.1 FAD-dependent oxidoreductase [Bdellovibrio svalbardensis]
MAISAEVSGPDFSKGVSVELIAEGESILGHVGDKAILLSKIEDQFYAIGAHCTHYGGPLNEGLITGETVHCPWHHAVFSLKTGEALKAPALTPVSCWSIEVRDDKVFVTGKRKAAVEPRAGTEKQQFVIVGGGAAGTAAAVMLRRKGFLGSIHLLSEDEALPYDRTNLSKDYLAGNAPEEWIPLWGQEFYRKHDIKLELNAKVMKIDGHRKHLFLADGRSLKFDKCLIATGGTPVKPPIPGIEQDHVYMLRSLKDCRHIIDRTSWAQKVAFIGSGFIALEAAAALRARNLEVHIVAPEDLPLIKVVGVHVGSYLKKLHEEHGVHFHLGHGIKEIRARSIVLDDKTSVACDFVIVGAGVRPNTLLAEQAGCKVDKGVLVDEYLETSVPGIYAAGDIARWPDPHSNKHIRVEHWEVAERQGQIAALNMLGDGVKFQEVPFFWTQHYDTSLGYVGNGGDFDRMEVFGDLGKNDFAVAFYDDERVAALLTVGRDRESLLIEDAITHFDNKKVQETLLDYERRLHSKHTPTPNYFEPSP